MPFSKQYGPVTVSESAGVVTIAVSISGSAGGGSLGGVASGSLTASGQMSGAQLVDAGLLYAEAKYPQLAAEIAALKALVDAEISKL